MREFTERTQHGAWHTAGSACTGDPAAVTIRMTVGLKDLVLCKERKFRLSGAHGSSTKVDPI